MGGSRSSEMQVMVLRAVTCLQHRVSRPLFWAVTAKLMTAGAPRGGDGEGDEGGDGGEGGEGGECGEGDESGDGDEDGEGGEDEGTEI